MLCMVVLFCHVGSRFSAIMGDASLERLIYAAHAQDRNVHDRHILLDNFGDGSVMKMTFTSPNKGRVKLKLMDEAEENTVLSVPARYEYLNDVDTLVLNGYKAGVGWGKELRSKGF